MSSFDRLHPALQHHIVNSLGWRELRPLQEVSIEPILEGKHVLLLAPTAGGKTEAAFLPILSRMLTEGWTRLSVIYVCPLKALLNNLHTRLEHYSRLVGRTCALWHGDVQQAQRKRVLLDEPDCLLTTPESLEAMLVSRRVNHRDLFANVRAIVVDEIHAFAGDDRGWHLLAVLERICRLTRTEPQRIGLSATVGNPKELLEWLAGHCEGNLEAVVSPATDEERPHVLIDYVGSLENAAVVISRLHRGEKRLVFCDSRSRVEQLGTALRRLGVETFLSHSSLSAEERRQAETAFSQSRNCVIAATSTLELGIDVGDLDRVIQIDASTTVSSFLQRLGRAGRRAGSTRNCLFLATSLEALHRATALVSLWQDGYVEPVLPPPLPLHLLGQQILALVLQEGGIGRQSWPEWLRRLPPVVGLSPAEQQEITDHLVEQTILHDDQGILTIGAVGEADYGYRYFSDLLSVFTTSPLFAVMYGRREVGSVDQANFLGRDAGGKTLSLAGRGWHVTHLDWKARRAYVEPAEAGGRTRWTGSAPGLSYTVAQRMLGVVCDDNEAVALSERGREWLSRLREDFSWARAAHTFLVSETQREETRWWTFAGASINQALVDLLCSLTSAPIDSDSLSIEIPLSPREVRPMIEGLQQSPPDTVPTADSELLSEGMKFSELLPTRLREAVLRARTASLGEMRDILDRPVRMFES